jgi:hypothetical protein
MGGFSAISAANGWLIATLGISVVFFGLVSLALIISFFPLAIGWWNAHVETPIHLVPTIKRLLSHRDRKVVITPAAGESHEPGDLSDAEEALRLLTAHMGEPFMLPRLIEVAEQRGLARVHSTLNAMLVEGTMVGGPDGLFCWTATGDKETSSVS